MISILFVCENNQVHSQIAECICKFLGNRICNCDSAGIVRTNIPHEVVQMLENMYGVNILENQSSKSIQDLQKTYDIVIAMNTKVEIEAGYIENWTLQSHLDENLVGSIEQKIMQLLHEIKIGEIQ